MSLPEVAVTDAISSESNPLVRLKAMEQTRRVIQQGRVKLEDTLTRVQRNTKTVKKQLATAHSWPCKSPILETSSTEVVEMFEK